MIPSLFDSLETVDEARKFFSVKTRSVITTAAAASAQGTALATIHGSPAVNASITTPLYYRILWSSVASQ